MATATPRKTNVTAIVPNISVCVACSLESKQRYYILSKSGSEGPSYHVAENFYHVSFKSEVNNGSFLCMGCKRLLQRILDMEEQTQKLVQKVNQSSQELNVRVSQKRCITLTPNNRDKRANLAYSPVAFPMTSKRGLFMEHQSEDICSKDTAIQCHLPVSTHVSEKKEIHQYLSISHKKKVQPAVKCLVSGSLRKCMRLLLTNPDSTVKEKVVAGITDVIRQECKRLNRSVFQKTDSFEFSMKETTDSIKSMSISWNVLKTIAETKEKISDTKKVTTAACVLLNSRSKFLNKLQHNVAVALYNNHLQKEGFYILHKLGITVGHSTLQRSLNASASVANETMYTLKSQVEQNKGVEVKVNIEERLDHDYAAPADNRTVQDPHFEPGYRFNLDNLDFYLRVRDMTETHQNQSKHYVQIMAVKDRVNCEHLSDKNPIGDLNEVENHQLMPSAEDNNSLREDMIHIISLTLIRVGYR